MTEDIRDFYFLDLDEYKTLYRYLRDGTLPNISRTGVFNFQKRFGKAYLLESNIYIGSKKIN